MIFVTIDEGILDVIGTIPEDNQILEYDVRWRAIFELPKENKVFEVVGEILEGQI